MVQLVDMYAIVRINGKQYQVSKGDTIDVDKLEGEVGSTLKIDDVLMVGDDGKTTIGDPVVKGAMVKAKILEQKKGKKIEVRRFKAKSRYRRKTGFRPMLTSIEISSITQK